MTGARAVAAVAWTLLGPHQGLLAVWDTPLAGQSAPPTEVVTELRIHGNYSVPDADVMQMAGIAPGDPIGPDTLDTIRRAPAHERAVR